MENSVMLNILSVRIGMYCKKMNIQYQLTQFTVTFFSSFSRDHSFSVRTLSAGSCSVASFTPCVRRAVPTNQCRIIKLSRNARTCEFMFIELLKTAETALQIRHLTESFPIFRKKSWSNNKPPVQGRYHSSTVSWKWHTEFLARVTNRFRFCP